MIVVRLVSVIHSSSAVVCLCGTAVLSAFAKGILTDGSRFVGYSELMGQVLVNAVLVHQVKHYFTFPVRLTGDLKTPIRNRMLLGAYGNVRSSSAGIERRTDS